MRTVVVDGLKGTFIPAPSMNRITFVLTECLPGYQELIAKQGKLLDLQARTIETSSAAFSGAKENARDERVRGERWKEAYVDDHKLLLEERAANDSFFRSPVLWFAIGVAVGAGATVGIAFAYAKAVESK